MAWQTPSMILTASIYDYRPGIGDVKKAQAKTPCFIRGFILESQGGPTRLP
jgi:hypothetical protein